MTGCVRCHRPIRRRYISAAYCIQCKRDYEKEVARASQILKKAIAAGKLPHPRSLLCADCGVAAFCYDHRDYSKPIKVAPVCRKCNWERGPAVWRIPVQPKGRA